MLTINGQGQRPTTNDQRPTTTRRRSERGYILLMLMLFVTLMVIAAGVVAPTIAFRVRRDREEEMIHRGTQYSRAIQRYVKKTGRYPELASKIWKIPTTFASCAGATRTPSRARISNCCTWEKCSSPVRRHSRSQSYRGRRGPGWGSGPARSSQHACSEEPPPRPRRVRAANPCCNFWCECSRRLWRGHDRSQPGFAGCVQVRLAARQAGLAALNLSSAVFGGGPIVGVASISKATDDSRVQSQEPLQPVAVHLRPHHGSRRPDHHAGAACVAIGSPAAAAEFIQPQFNGNAGLFWRDAECAAGAADTASRNNRNLRIVWRWI